MEIRLLGRNLITTYNHYIMKLDIKPDETPIARNVILNRVNTDNIELLSGSYYSTTPMKNFLLHNSDKVEGYYLSDQEGKECIAYGWVAYKGYDHRHYRINTIDAYLFKVSTMPKYRGKGYCGDLIKLLTRELSSQEIDSLYLAVMKNNESAIRAYKKAGFSVVGHRFFVRFLRWNIPYYKL